MNQQQKEQIEDSGLLYRNIMRRAFEGKSSPRAAIKAFCLHCTGYVRKDVADCTALACPLFAYRPYQDKDARLDDPEDRSEEHTSELQSQR